MNGTIVAAFAFFVILSLIAWQLNIDWLAYLGFGIFGVICINEWMYMDNKNANKK